MTPETKIKNKFRKDKAKQGVTLFALSDRYHSGYPDFISCIDGHFVAYEIKAFKGKWSKAQELFAKTILKLGGTYWIIRGSDPSNKNYVENYMIEDKSQSGSVVVKI